MSYQPVIPAGGNLGWTFLSQTRIAQQTAFARSPSISLQTDYFRDRIGDIRSAQDLVDDRRLLAVALGAFGLGDDIDNKFFIRKVLEEGVDSENAFANKLADKRYFSLAEAFRFDLSPPNTVVSEFADRIISEYRSREFEVAVGNQDQNLRLALGLDRDISNLVERDLSEKAAWFTIMGTPPLRRVFETALGLPTATAGIDVDKQLDIFRTKSMTVFGTSDPKDFAEPEMREDLTRRFLLRADIAAAASNTVRGSVALSLLSSQVPVVL